MDWLICDLWFVLTLREEPQHFETCLLLCAVISLSVHTISSGMFDSRQVCGSQFCGVCLRVMVCVWQEDSH